MFRGVSIITGTRPKLFHLHEIPGFNTDGVSSKLFLFFCRQLFWNHWQKLQKDSEKVGKLLN